MVSDIIKKELWISCIPELPPGLREICPTGPCHWLTPLERGSLKPPDKIWLLHYARLVSGGARGGSAWPDIGRANVDKFQADYRTIGRERAAVMTSNEGRTLWFLISPFVILEYRVDTFFSPPVLDGSMRCCHRNRLWAWPEKDSYLNSYDPRGE